MSKRNPLVLVVDVETAGTFGRELVYDLGFAVVNKSTGEIVDAHSLVIHDVFYGMEDKMQSAYYGWKLPEYVAGILAGEWQVVTFWEAWRRVRDTMRKYGIHKVYAYNCGFDKRALNSTMKQLTNGRFHNFFPKGTEFCDIWHMACQTIMSQRNYVKFCNRNGFVTEHGNIKTSAETCYAYIKRTPDFEESHTGLADVVIEAQILAHVMRVKRKRVDEGIVGSPWQIPQRVRKIME